MGGGQAGTPFSEQAGESGSQGGRHVALPATSAAAAALLAPGRLRCRSVPPLRYGQRDPDPGPWALQELGIPQRSLPKAGSRVGGPLAPWSYVRPLNPLPRFHNEIPQLWKVKRAPGAGGTATQRQETRLSQSRELSQQDPVGAAHRQGGSLEATHCPSTLTGKLMSAYG